jgi:hypothetical protein
MQLERVRRVRAFLRRTVKRTVVATQDSIGLAVIPTAARDRAIAAAPHVARFLLREELVKPPTGTVPADAAAYLNEQNAGLTQLRRRYQGHPACNHTQWSPTDLRKAIDLKYFRADNMYLYQSRRYSPLAFYATASFTKHVDELGLFDGLHEDDYFGAELHDFHGKPISRDLLDSILEINILCKYLPIGRVPFTILDIGAGYGRLAHRLTSAFPNVRYYCVDAVPESTFISEYYLKFREASRCTSVPLDELTRRHFGRIDLAVNIHSFPECQLSVIEWWVRRLHDMAVPWLFVGVAANLGLTSRELDGHRESFLDPIAQIGYRLRAVQQKFQGVPALQSEGLYPTDYYLFSQSTK